MQTQYSMILEMENRLSSTVSGISKVAGYGSSTDKDKSNSGEVFAEILENAKETMPKAVLTEDKQEKYSARGEVLNGFMNYYNNHAQNAFFYMTGTSKDMNL